MLVVNLKSLDVEYLCIVELLLSFGQFQQAIYECIHKGLV